MNLFFFTMTQNWFNRCRQVSSFLMKIAPVREVLVTIHLSSTSLGMVAILTSTSTSYNSVSLLAIVSSSAFAFFLFRASGFFLNGHLDLDLVLGLVAPSPHHVPLVPRAVLLAGERRGGVEGRGCDGELGHVPVLLQLDGGPGEVREVTGCAAGWVKGRLDDPSPDLWVFFLCRSCWTC